MTRTLRALARAAVGSASDLVSGREVLGPLGRAAFFRSVLSALRPHFFALPAGAALAGAALGQEPGAGPRIALATTAAAVGWGVGQLLNDLMDVQADAVDAPVRPAVRGLLPDGPTMLVALSLGLLVAAATLSVHPHGYLLALAATVLLLSYDTLKPFPLLGNLAHGALIGVATVIGAAAARRSLPLAELFAHAAAPALCCAGWAAVYLEANYEKDRRGDAHANKRTLPQIIGLRASALVRLMLGAALTFIALRLGLPEAPTGTALLVLATFLLSVSALGVLVRPNEASALKGYRFAVHAAALGLLALGSRALGTPLTLLLCASSAVLTELAFARSANP
jgi:geranylgeranylglycerol-phosphate geranylgeranyltransferase